MCSISVLYKKNIIENTEDFLKFRGPDSQFQIEMEGFLMKHYLLSVTGSSVKQPIVDEKIVCLFNGEIYNYKIFGDFESDVYSIINSYKKYGDKFIKKLDGEFAIFLIDFEKKIFFISSDVFGTKPLYYSFDDGFGCSSQETFLHKNNYKNIKRILPNKTLKFDFSFNLLSESDVYEFSLDQYENSFDIWTENFLNSIKKRFEKVNYDIILPLSSGHDSGGIACAFNILGIPYNSFSIDGKEDLKILSERITLNKNNYYLSNKLDKDFCDSLLKTRCEPFYYGQNYNGKEHFGFDDPGAKGLIYILSEIKKLHPNTKILASGQGSDEIMSNNQNYSFGGEKNPHTYDYNTLNYFPWKNFFEGANYSYLNKEESISGCFGIEGRYPYLDKKVVQSFLNLKPELKNMYFKAPLTNFLLKNNYPINSIKQGFNPSF